MYSLSTIRLGLRQNFVRSMISYHIDEAHVRYMLPSLCMLTHSLSHHICGFVFADAVGAGQVMASGAFRVHRLPTTHHWTDVQSARRTAGVLRMLSEQVLRDLLPVQAAHSGGKWNGG